MKRTFAMLTALLLFAGCNSKDDGYTSTSSDTNSVVGVHRSRRMTDTNNAVASQSATSTEPGSSVGTALSRSTTSSGETAPAEPSSIGYSASVSMNTNTSISGTVSKVTDLIGKEVKNQQNQTLGKIDNLAIDMQSGRIAYAVLSTGGFLGAGAKYIAVPLQAISPGKDKDTFQMAASKEQIDAAAGVDKDNLPAQPSAMWGASRPVPQPAGQATIDVGNTRIQFNSPGNQSQQDTNNLNNSNTDTNKTNLKSQGNNGLGVSVPDSDSSSQKSETTPSQSDTQDSSKTGNGNAAGNQTSDNSGTENK